MSFYTAKVHLSMLFSINIRPKIDVVNVHDVEMDIFRTYFTHFWTKMTYLWKEILTFAREIFNYDVT